MRNNIDLLLDKYWAGESDLHEEARLSEYFCSSEVESKHEEFIPLFKFFDSQRAIGLEQELDLSQLTQTHTGQTKVRRLMPSLVAAAACMLLLVFFGGDWLKNKQATAYVNNQKITSDEAYEITKEALALLSVNYEKGSEPMKHVKQLDNTKIFSF